LFEVKITSQRQNTNQRWWHSDADMLDYIQETFIDTGKILDQKIELSDNQCKKQHTIVFDSEDSYHEWLADEVLVYERQRMRKFHNTNRIAHSINAYNIKVTKDLYSVYEH
jgi:hypothetical protein